MSRKLRVAAVVLALTHQAVSAAEPLSIEAAIQPKVVTQAAISPDGLHAVAIDYDGYGYHVNLIDLQTFEHKILLRGDMVREGHYTIFKEPYHVSWITNGLLAVDYGIIAEARDLSGKKVASLGADVIGKVRPGDASSTLMLVYADDKFETLAVVDAATGKSRPIALPASGKPVNFAFDELGELRAVTLRDSSFWRSTTKLTQWYRPLRQQPWVQVDEFSANDETWIPFSASAEREGLLVLSRHGRDTWALFDYDPLQRTYGALRAGQDGEDIGTVRRDGQSNLMSYTTLGMKPRQLWLDERWAALQAELDAALPGRINIPSGDPKGRVLVYSYSDRDPGRWYLLNVTDMTMRLLLIGRAGVVPKSMQAMQVIDYPSADGLRIPAYLTVPDGGQGARPMVVMVHGGPAVRDHWGWNAEVQLLSSRGYVVFQPQFRGSSGFGRAFQELGYGQWGLSMQDDITAGVRHLVKLGIADPQRICIYGASYGGYAAYWGLIKTPELYRCGISLSGVSDIGELFTDWSDTNSDSLSRELMRFRLGDQGRGAQGFDAVSPVKHAGRINVPLLIAHGDEDLRVRISHSKRMMRALDSQSKGYEWLELEGEGHSLGKIKSQRRFYEAMIKFLDRHIGRAPTSVEAADALTTKGASAVVGRPPSSP